MKPKCTVLKTCRYLLVIICCSLSLFTKAQTTAIKVGDRVMVSPSGLKDEKYWRPGTVTEVHNFTPKKAYTVKCDPLSATDAGSSFLVNQDWIRPGAERQPVTPTAQPRDRSAQQAPVNPTTATMNGKPAACPPSDPDSKGATALERAFRSSIRKGFERTAEPNSDGAVTVTFMKVNVGNAHSYQEFIDPPEARGKEVYRVMADFSTCTDYHTRIVIVKRERAFGCYKNTAGQWVCDVVAAANTNVKDQSQSIDKPRK